MCEIGHFSLHLLPLHPQHPESQPRLLTLGCQPVFCRPSTYPRQLPPYDCVVQTAVGVERRQNCQASVATVPERWTERNLQVAIKSNGDVKPLCEACHFLALGAWVKPIKVIYSYAWKCIRGKTARQEGKDRKDEKSLKPKIKWTTCQLMHRNPVMSRNDSGTQKDFIFI